MSDVVREPPPRSCSRQRWLLDASAAIQELAREMISVQKLLAVLTAKQHRSIAAFTDECSHGCELAGVRHFDDWHRPMLRPQPILDVNAVQEAFVPHQEVRAIERAGRIEHIVEEQRLVV